MYPPTFIPRSSSVLSSTEPEIIFHLVSMSAKYPRKIGDEAESANCTQRGNRVIQQSAGLVVTITILFEGETTHQHWTHHSQLVIQVPGFLNVTCLEGDLKTGATHSKPHAVHVDMIRFSIPSCTTIIIGKVFYKWSCSLHISVYWNSDIRVWIVQL